MFQLINKKISNYALQSGGLYLFKSIAYKFDFRSDPKDARILAQLISAYSKFDPAKAQR